MCRIEHVNLHSFPSIHVWIFFVHKIASYLNFISLLFLRLHLVHFPSTSFFIFYSISSKLFNRHELGKWCRFVYNTFLFFTYTHIHTHTQKHQQLFWKQHKTIFWIEVFTSSTTTHGNNEKLVFWTVFFLFFFIFINIISSWGAREKKTQQNSRAV